MPFSHLLRQVGIPWTYILSWYPREIRRQNLLACMIMFSVQLEIIRNSSTICSLFQSKIASRELIGPTLVDEFLTAPDYIDASFLQLLSVNKLCGRPVCLHTELVSRQSLTAVHFPPRANQFEANMRHSVKNSYQYRINSSL
jgi:hypothetical protein